MPIATKKWTFCLLRQEELIEDSDGIFRAGYCVSDGSRVGEDLIVVSTLDMSFESMTDITAKTKTETHLISFVTEEVNLLEALVFDML